MTYTPIFTHKKLQSEAHRDEAPTEFELAELECLMRDFGYKKPLPKFKTVKEMDSWRKRTLTA